jgi:short-subunit dehydrogenase
MKARTKISLGLIGLGAGLMARNLRMQARERRISGEVVLITGGSRGLGLALAQRLIREDCRIAICARDQAELERAKLELNATGENALSNVMSVVCDVTDRSQVDHMIQDVTERLGPIDILINNAGQIKVGPLSSMGLDDFQSALDVMFWGTVYPSLTILPSFIARNQGHIVNITSIGGKVAVPHLLPYTSAKSAAVGFSEGLRGELRETAVRVTTIIPGLMRTGSWNAAMFKGDQNAESVWFSLGASLPGISMGAEEAADQIVRAIKRGDAEFILGKPATLLAKSFAIAPELTQDALGLISAALLPSQKSGSARDSHRARPGWSLPVLRTPGMKAMLFLGRAAARRLNQRLT